VVPPADHPCHGRAVEMTIAATQSSKLANSDGIVHEQSESVSFSNSIQNRQAPALVGDTDPYHAAMKGRRILPVSLVAHTEYVIIFLGDYVESLYHIWERGAGNATFAKYLESYIAVQVE
jgi:hypothetical protein